MVQDGHVLHEIKTIAGDVQKHDKEQFEDFMKLVNKKDGTAVTKGDETYTVKKAVYTFSVPEGVEANAAWMKKKLRKNENLVFEVFNRAGEKMRISHDQINEFDALLHEFMARGKN